MTELEKITYAKSFIDKLANGINPLDDTPIPDDDIANNVRLSRCFFYVSDILRQVCENGGIQKPKKVKKKAKKPFYIPPERLECFEFSDTPISATVIAKRINYLAADGDMERISYRHIIQWLLNIGMLDFKDVGNGKMKRTPTADGEAIGIVLQFRGNINGKTYPVTFYTREAQQFIIDNIEAVAATEIKKGKMSYTAMTNTDSDGTEE